MRDLALQFIGALIVGLVAIPFVLLRRRRQDAEAMRVAIAGLRTQGTVLEVWSDAEGWNVTYQFTPAGTTAHVQRTEALEGEKQKPVEIGAPVEVAYEPGPPYHSFLVIGDRDTRASAA
jgi:hypothetical protein